MKISNSVYQGLLTSVISSVAFFAFAATITAQSCGDFVTYETEYDEVADVDYEVEVRQPIENCANPFNADSPDPFLYNLVIEGTSITPGSVVTIPVGVNLRGNFTIDIESSGGLVVKNLVLFRKDSPDYYRIRYSRGSTISLENPVSGEYVAVLTYMELMVSQETSWWQQLIGNLFGEVAHAYFPDHMLVVAVPFTVIVEEQPPAGASSVLFLPGIQASKLYMPGGLVSGLDTVWPPDELFNMDVRNLRMTEDGQSIEDIGTYDVLESVLGLGSIYAGFLDFLDAQKSTNFPIADYTAFPYDWRYDVYSVATEDVKYRDGTFKNLRNEIIRLADGSHTGKVTIIAHSNGGLVTKAFMSEYQDELAGKIDRIILIGSPQLGTPKAIGALLHGYDETAGLTGTFKHGVDVREVINNMPGAYGLLPSEAYFEAMSEPMITFDDSATTEPYRNQYGSEISSYAAYLNFLKGNDGLSRDMSDNLAIPVRLNANMVDSAASLHRTRLDNWVAPDSVEVIEIVGTGLPTMKSVEYREVIEKKCFLGLFSCEDVVEMKPYASLTKYGDKTVAQISAESYFDSKSTYFVDLIRIRQGIPVLGTRYDHANLTEASKIQQLILSILNDTDESSEFITTQSPVFDDVYDIELMDSPVRMLATDSMGRKTGIDIENGEEVLRLEIPNSDYFEFGGTKYLVIPSDTDRVTELFGEDYGGYTLTVATLNESDEQEIKSQLKNATVTPTMVARYEKDAGEYSTVLTDLEGDGIYESETTLDGDEITPPVVEVSYQMLIDKVKVLSLGKAKEKVLLTLIKSAEAASKKKQKIAKKLEITLLALVQSTVKQYQKKRYLSSEEANDIIELINELKK